MTRLRELLGIGTHAIVSPREFPTDWTTQRLKELVVPLLLILFVINLIAAPFSIYSWIESEVRTQDYEDMLKTTVLGIDVPEPTGDVVMEQINARITEYVLSPWIFAILLGLMVYAAFIAVFSLASIIITGAILWLYYHIFKGNATFPTQLAAITPFMVLGDIISSASVMVDYLPLGDPASLTVLVVLLGIMTLLLIQLIKLQSHIHSVSTLKSTLLIIIPPILIALMLLIFIVGIAFLFVMLSALFSA